MPRTWQPILEGELRARALALVDDIAKTLEDREISPDLYGGMAGGSAGIAMFHAYLALDPDLGGKARVDTAMRYVDHAIGKVAETIMPEGIYSGFSGVSWVLEHVFSLLSGVPGLDDDDEDDDEDAGDEDGDGDGDEDEDDGDVNEQIDEALCELLSTTPWVRDYDLISGLVGLGVYALERLPRDSARTMLLHIIDRLEELSQPGNPGVTWHTRPDLLPPHQRETHPDGYYNLGIAHGVPGIVGLLGQVHAAGVDTERVRRLLDGTVEWLWSRKLPDEAQSWFDWAYYPDVPWRRSRLAWCYGDPGIAATFLLTGRIAGGDWLERAREMARDIAGRPHDLAGVVDHGICHGGAGFAHIYNRMYQETGDEQLLDQARHWIEWTLDARLEDSPSGLVRFRDLTQLHPEDPPWSDEIGFLTGTTGVALVMLAAANRIEPKWDRVLLLSSVLDDLEAAQPGKPGGGT